MKEKKFAENREETFEDLWGAIQRSNTHGIRNLEGKERQWGKNNVKK